VVFSCKSVHAWKMVNSLVGLHFIEALDSYSAVTPIKVPLLALVLGFPVRSCQFEPQKFFSRVLNDMVLGLEHIHYELFLFKLFSFFCLLFVQLSCVKF
jgi:hypothetical protein